MSSEEIAGMLPFASRTPIRDPLYRSMAGAPLADCTACPYCMQCTVRNVPDQLDASLRVSARPKG